MKSLHVDGCPFCKIFEELYLPTELYYPKASEIKKFDDFVIINYKKKHIVVVTDHVQSVSKEQWGRVLYKCKELYGQGTRLKMKMYPIRDHWYAEIVCSNQRDYTQKDLRGQ